MIGQRLLHYEITEKLGEGGMGVVYKARDTHLDRFVAIKVLPQEFVQDPDRRKRLEREAKTTSALKHPSITHIYDVGRHNETCFIAMEYVEGTSLQTRLAAGPIDLGETLDIGIQLADALAEAHSAGVTHRDIKPANIMLTPQGHVKILDFGLAKWKPQDRESPLSQASTETQTQAGAVVGTFPYMSPEQALGRGVDARTDLFSLGVVLYEMLTGHRPFQGSTPTETIARIASSEPEPMRRFSKDVPEELERIVRKCLEKGPPRRYQSAREIEVDLRNLKRDSESPHPAPPRRRLVYAAVAALVILIAVLAGLYLTRTSGPAIHSIAVLPFENETSDAEMTYLCDGLSENLINSLSKLSDLKVISRRSSFRFRKNLDDPKAVAKALDVQAVLVGHITRKGDRVLVSAELVNAQDQTQIWGAKYERRFSDLVDIEGDLAKAITATLRLKLSGDETARLTRRQTDDPEAYRLYLIGRQLMIGTRPEMNKAADYLNQAIGLEPGYALAHAYLSQAYLQQALHGVGPGQDLLERARAAAKRALELDENLAEAHTALGWILFEFDWDWKRAEAAFRRATELNPASSDAYVNYANYLALVDRFEEAHAASLKAKQLDPLSTYAAHMLALVRLARKDYDGSVSEFQSAINLNPSWTWGYIKMGVAYANKGMFREALLAAETAEGRLRQGDTPMARAWLGYVYATSGRKERAREALVRFRRSTKTLREGALNEAIIHAGLRDKQHVLELLEQGLEQRSVDMIYIKALPIFFWPGLESEPRFQQVVQRMGLPVSAQKP